MLKKSKITLNVNFIIHYLFNILEIALNKIESLFKCGSNYIQVNK